MSESWITYLLLCADGKIYCGVTNDMEKRLDAHNQGIASRFTRARLPVTLLATSSSLGKAEAFRLEYKIKRLPRSKKLTALTSTQRPPSTGTEGLNETNIIGQNPSGGNKHEWE